ncbi:hypothetical protein RHMOL_Rhmol08G0133900 [Rhododendron molle]|uniref:Uncharacterized protein n=1 Tax=Rhododendron molle TaxID=49168 RepID=A0ACC0MN36_RHOML|nr:hypothetical protein RHMOL_Rhmol08G0133900 [Rhododendron molle]
MQTSHASIICICQTKWDIGDQWKSMSNEKRQKYKDLVEAAKEEVAKYKDLFPVAPKEGKTKLQNRISLKSIVRIVQKLSADQRRAVEEIGLGGILQLRCTFLNHVLCKWLVSKFDPISRSLTVHGRTFVVTESHVHECLGSNAQGNVIDLEGNASDSCEEVCKNLGMRNGVVQLKDLREYLDKTKEVHEGGGGGAFHRVGEGSGNEGGVSQISTADVQTMTSTFVTVAGLLLRQNMFMAKLLGYEIQCNPQGKMARGMDVNNVQLMGQAATLLKGLHSCQISSPTVFETPDPAIEKIQGFVNQSQPW